MTRETRTVRISARTHQDLRELSVQSGKPMTKILDHVVERYRRDQILKEANRQWAAIMKDPQAKAEIEAEMAILDGTLADGLDPEEW